MTSDQDPTPGSRPAWHWALIGLVAAVVLVAAALAGTWLAPMIRGGDRRPQADALTSPKPAPAAAAAPAPAAETPTTTIEASRDARPRPRKKIDAPAPTPAAPAAPASGELHIDSDVPGAMVFLDRKFVGNTPVTAKDVPPGTHQLNLTAEGYDGYSEAIDVAIGPADVTVRFKEIRLKEAVDVVHKHTMGSCEGRLSADPQGIRYDTTNKDDAFSLKFAEIETFEVDYLKKNLRIRKRGGKQYNFTTKAANADPLFVFHRTVDMVRQLVAGTAPVKR
jgi:hypothetical protein